MSQGKPRWTAGRPESLRASGSHCCSGKGDGQSCGHEDTSSDWNDNGLSGLALIKRERQDTTHLSSLREAVEAVERPSTKTSHITQEETHTVGRKGEGN